MMSDEYPQDLSVQNREVVLFTSFTLLFGLLFALLTPPFQSPDEPNHFFRSWQVSEGRFFPEKNGSRLGGMLPVSLSQVRDSFSFLKNNADARLSEGTLRQVLDIPLNSDRRGFIDFANTAIYAPTAYLPQAAAIALLRPFGATPLQMLYAARLSNLAVWIALVVAAFRLMPFLNSSIAAWAMLPASLCIAASANADVLTNGLCWWLIAAFIAAPKSVCFWKKLFVVIVVSANKLIAMPLVLLGFSNKTERRHGAILLGLGVLAAVWWGILAQNWFIAYDAYDPAFRDSQTLNSGVDPPRQIAFVFEHPGFFIKTCLESFFKALPSISAHMVGKFGWEKNYLPTGWILMLWLMMGLLAMSQKNPLTTRARWWLVLVITLYLGAFSVTMYALWSPFGATVMDNWQGRYFVPIAPVAILAIAQDWLGKWRRKMEVAAYILLFMSNVVMAGCIWLRYYAVNP